MREQTYIHELIGLLGRLMTEERERIDAAADIVARSMADGGVLHVFGTGHSGLIAQEAFMRAGGLLPVNAMLDERILLSGGALSSAVAEKQDGLAAEILSTHDVRPGDAGVVISNSGRNAAPVEMAIELKKRGVPVIAITSRAHSASAPASHPSGKKLADLADIALDNKAPYGDALVEFEGVGARMGPASTVTGAAIINCVLLMAAEKMMDRGAEPLALPSGNVASADYARIQEAMDRYRERIRYL